MKKLGGKLNSSAKKNQKLLTERVPEHSLPLMAAMSQGRPLRAGDYQFYCGGDWLLAIAYPLQGPYRDADFESALSGALEESGAERVFAIGPRLPERLSPHIVSRDRFYVLGSGAPLPARLRSPVKKAESLLSVTESAEFTPEHRRLWNEFLSFRGSGGKMAPRVMELYLRAPEAIPLCGGSLRLLDAWDQDGNLAASLLLDYSPQYFTSYILGAHSRKHNTPHAMDLLFWKMIQNSKNAGKRYIHLGLGVNDGILRFKLKWGAKAHYPYLMASWEKEPTAQRGGSGLNEVARGVAFALMRGGGQSARQALGELPRTSPFAMIWEIEKNNKVSWVAGTAHFFCRSFEPSFRKLFKKADKAIFEGPLDNGFMEQVDAAGKVLPPGKKPLAESLGPEEIARLDRLVNGPPQALSRMLSGRARGSLDVPRLLREGDYWYAFFTIWTKFLERQGWKESVDMEAWRVAGEMDLEIIAMESLEEQLESLSSLPMERVINFFKNCGQWKSFARRNKNAYLAGDLEKMMGSSTEFPTRTEHVVGRRDQRFRERMRPWLEKGNCAVFVGCAHMVNLRHMLLEDGFQVRQKPFGVWPKIHRKWRELKRPDDKVRW